LESILRQGEEEKDILYNEKTKLLKDILDLNLLHVVNCKELNDVQNTCSDMKGRLQFYAVKYTTMEVSLYESQFKYNSERSSKNIMMPSPPSSSKGIYVYMYVYIYLYVYIYIYVYICI
jgi:hypothetical protein